MSVGFFFPPFLVPFLFVWGGLRLVRHSAVYVVVVVGFSGTCDGHNYWQGSRPRTTRVMSQNNPMLLYGGVDGGWVSKRRRGGTG